VFKLTVKMRGLVLN